MAWTLYTDGSAQPNPGPCGCGAVLLDETGTVAWTLSEFLGQGTNNTGELTAIKRGVSRAKSLGATELDVHSDSELSVSIMNGTKKTKKEHLAILSEEIKADIGCMRVTFSWIKAHNGHVWNEMADRLADASLFHIKRDESPKQMPSKPLTSETSGRLDLKCPFTEKDEVKSLGARWDANTKTWWAQDTKDNKAKFAKWLR